MSERDRELIKCARFARYFLHMTSVLAEPGPVPPRPPLTARYLFRANTGGDRGRGWLAGALAVHEVVRATVTVPENRIPVDP